MILEGSFLLILSFGNLCCWVPLLLSLIFRKVQYFHRRITSDIPGNPHAFDNSIISLMRTLPEPSNFNLCWTGLSLTEPLRIRGEMPPARINSITIYPRGSNDPPVTLDLATLPTSITPDGRRMIDVILTSSPVTDGHSSDNKYRCGVLQYPKHWSNGFIAMRNFCVPNGTRVVSPEITHVRDGKVVRESEILVAGVTSLQNLESTKVKKILFLNIVTFACLYFYFHIPLQSIGIIILLGLFIAKFLYNQLYKIGKKGLKKHLTDIVPHNHVFKLPDLQKASETSQPSLDHRYWIMKYDVTKINHDLLIQFNIQRNYQKYWSLVVYDEYGIPLPQFYNLENILHFPENTSLPTTFDPKDTSQYHVTIRLTRFPPSRKESSIYIRNDENSSTSTSLAYGTIDIRDARIGYVIFRIVHPTCKEVMELSAPEVHIAPHSPTTEIPNDVQTSYFLEVMM